MKNKELVKQLVLEMGNIIRCLDDDGSYGEFWTNDGGYCPNGLYSFLFVDDNISKSFLDEVSKLTEINHHTEARILVCKFLNFELLGSDLLSSYRLVLERQELLGYLDSADAEKMRVLDVELKKLVPSEVWAVL